MNVLEAVKAFRARLANQGQDDSSVILALLGYRLPVVHVILLLLVFWGVSKLFFFSDDGREPEMVQAGGRQAVDIALPPSTATQPQQLVLLPDPVVEATPATPPSRPDPVPDAVPLPVSPEPAAKPVRSGMASSPLLKSELWLLSQNPEHYTLQLLGTRQEKTLEAFVREHGVDTSEVSFYRTVHNGGDWYVLLFGVFGSHDEARASISRLPASVRKNAPWPRSYGSVQAAIQKSAQAAGNLQ